jgi:hypothetical protein
MLHMHLGCRPHVFVNTRPKYLLKKIMGSKMTLKRAVIKIVCKC